MWTRGLWLHVTCVGKVDAITVRMPTRDTTASRGTTYRCSRIKPRKSQALLRHCIKMRCTDNFVAIKPTSPHPRSSHITRTILGLSTGAARMRHGTSRQNKVKCFTPSYFSDSPMNKSKKSTPIWLVSHCLGWTPVGFNLIRMDGFMWAIRDQVGHDPNHTGHNRGDLIIKSVG